MSVRFVAIVALLMSGVGTLISRIGVRFVIVMRLLFSMGVAVLFLMFFEEKRGLFGWMLFACGEQGGSRDSEEDQEKATHFNHGSEAVVYGTGAN